jgi:predicted nucleic acid-binding protein
MKKTGQFVLDGSVALAWFFADEANPYADKVLASFPSTEAVVPAIWPLEVANAVVMGERRKRSTVAQASKWLAILGSLPVNIDGETVSRAWGDVLNLARTHNLSSYDAAYLELAIRLGLPQATLDDQLKAACAKAGVPLFKP